jgi:hypothetical protein
MVNVRWARKGTKNVVHQVGFSIRQELQRDTMILNFPAGFNLIHVIRHVNIIIDIRGTIGRLFPSIKYTRSPNSVTILKSFLLFTHKWGGLIDAHRGDGDRKR